MAFVTSFLPTTQLRPCTSLTTTRPRSRHVATPRMTAVQLTQYDALRSLTTIVEDTGEIDIIRSHRPHSATTNPSLVAAAATKPEYAHLLEEAVAYGNANTAVGSAKLDIVRNKLFTLFGAEILKYVPGDVSTEVDARLSFDVDEQIRVGQQIIDMYEEVGVGRERVLIKLATTWEGVQACKVLESKGIKTNMTLLFSMAQAVAAAEAGAFLISPFVGRILDWYKKAEGRDSYPANEDPGVVSVRDIYKYYKCMDYNTIVMGASFRNKEEILALAGCDRLTIGPKFIKQLKETEEGVDLMLDTPTDDECKLVDKIHMDEKVFRWMMNQDAMATEKLAEGIRNFAKDLEKLDRQLERLILTA